MINKDLEELMNVNDLTASSLAPPHWGGRPHPSSVSVISALLLSHLNKLCTFLLVVRLGLQ